MEIYSISVNSENDMLQHLNRISQWALSAIRTFETSVATVTESTGVYKKQSLSIK